ncbi:MAG: hypothetical protein AAB403_08130 [Planctomycetota bacterium]
MFLKRPYLLRDRQRDALAGHNSNGHSGLRELPRDCLDLEDCLGSIAGSLTATAHAGMYFHQLPG